MNRRGFSYFPDSGLLVPVNQCGQASIRDSSKSSSGKPNIRGADRKDSRTWFRDLGFRV